MENYYRILGVRPSASIVEIKHSFRKKAKLLHLDIPSNAASSADRKNREKEMQLLITAYEVLINPKLRAELDTFYARFQKETVDSGFDYRLWLVGQTDLESRTQLIVFDLFHNLEEEAVAEYLRLRAAPKSFWLSLYMDREDFMDFGFILAEELYLRDHHYEAFVILEEIIYEELKKNYFKHFFPEVLKLAKTLIIGKIIPALGDDIALECYEAAVDFGFESSITAELYKKMGECHLRIGDKELAIHCFRQALALNPRIRGISSTKMHTILENI